MSAIANLGQKLVGMSVSGGFSWEARQPSFLVRLVGRPPGTGESDDLVVPCAIDSGDYTGLRIFPTCFII